MGDHSLAPETAIVVTQPPPLAPSSATADDGLDAAFARFLRLDVANGDASVDTIRGYRSQLAAWYWARNRRARLATVEDLKRYREDW